MGAVCWPQASGQQGACAFASCVAAMTGQQGYCCSCPLWGYCQGQHVYMLLLFQTVSECVCCCVSVSWQTCEECVGSYWSWTVELGACAPSCLTCMGCLVFNTRVCGGAFQGTPPVKLPGSPFQGSVTSTCCLIIHSRLGFWGRVRSSSRLETVGVD